MLEIEMTIIQIRIRVGAADSCRAGNDHGSVNDSANSVEHDIVAGAIESQGQ